jgi:hypothetical protein
VTVALNQVQQLQAVTENFIQFQAVRLVMQVVEQLQLK